MGQGDACPAKHAVKVPKVGDTAIDQPGSTDSSRQEFEGLRVPAVEVEYRDSLLYHIMGGIQPNVGGSDDADIHFKSLEILRSSISS